MNVFMYGEKLMKVFQDDIERRQKYDEQCAFEQKVRMQWGEEWHKRFSAQNEKCLELLTQILAELKRGH